jgi:hypothetical protein
MAMLLCFSIPVRSRDLGVPPESPLKMLCVFISQRNAVAVAGFVLQLQTITEGANQTLGILLVDCQFSLSGGLWP